MTSRRAPLPGAPDSRHTRAVAACARALADVEHADTLLAESNAPTHSGLRAVADRLVLQRRFHDARIHADHQPGDAGAAELFDAVEQARLDALGAGWLPGIAKNLLAHPGAEDDGIRWLVFEAISGQPAPREKQALTARVKAELPESVLGGLRALRDASRDQTTFAVAAAAWVQSARGYVRRDHSSTAPGQSFTLPLRYIDKYQRRGRYESPVGTKGRGTRKETGVQAGGDEGSVTGWSRRRANGRRARLSGLHHRARPCRQRGGARQPGRARTAAPHARRRVERHTHDGGPPGQEAPPRAHGAPGPRMALRPRRRTARRLAPGADDCQPRRRASLQRGDRLAVPKHGGDAAHRPLGLDARPADADRGADSGNLCARARALQRQVRGARIHHARVGRRRAGPRMGGGRLSGTPRPA